MSILDLSLLLFALFSTSSHAAPLVERSVPSFVFAGDAPFSVPAATLAAALTCPYGNPTASAPPVLLVHGTASTGEETWGAGYVPALHANSYTPCYVTLPERAMGDMQISSEYVAYGLHMISYLAGGLHIAVVSHSQGGPDTQWALRFWPSTRNITRAFVPLSPDLAGIIFVDGLLADLCKDGLCQASLWQQSNGSHYYSAMHYSDFEALVPTTSIWTEFDGVVTPPENNAQLPGATVLSVQQLCPDRLSTHVEMPIDSAAFAIALDALNHGGIASLDRVLPDALSICLRIDAPNMSSSIASALTAAYGALVDGFLLSSTRLSAEPPVQSYALPPN